MDTLERRGAKPKAPMNKSTKHEPTVTSAASIDGYVVRNVNKKATG